MLMEALLVALAGLAFGSFITLASWRLPREEGLTLPPSRCTSCGARLGVRDLFPLFSWLFSRGRCRHCGVGVHWRYPAIEAVTALAFLAVYAAHGLNIESGLLMLACVALLVMIVVDFEHYLIPDEVQWALLALAVAYGWRIEAPWAEMAAGGAFGLALGLALKYGFRWLRGKEGLGMGDVKFLAVAGVWLGIYGMPVFLLLSGVLGVSLGIVWRLLKRGPYFPFGPALAMALFICVLFPRLHAIILQ